MKAVLRNAEDRALRGFDADHAIRQAANVDFAADWIAGRKQFGRDVRADVSDARGAFVFGSAKKRPSSMLRLSMSTLVGGGAGDEDVFQHLIAALDFGGSAAGLRADLADQRGASLSGNRNRPASALCCDAAPRRSCRCL